jgi:hypothetical protein
MSYTTDWVAAGRSAEQRAAEPCEHCGGGRVVGFSNLGVPIPACPTCQPTLVENGSKPVGEAWGFNDV